MQVSMTEAAEGPVSPPARYPNSMLLREIAESSIAQMICDEETLRVAQADLRERKRNIKVRREALLRNRNSVKTRSHQKFGSAINELHMERRRIAAALDALREVQGSRASARDKVTDLECEMRIAERVCADAAAKLAVEQEHLKNGTGAAKASEQRKVVERCRKDVAAREAEKQQKEEAYATARVEFNTSAPDFAERAARDEEFRELHAQMNAVMEELNTANQQRRVAATAAEDDAEKIDAAREAEEAVDAELEKVDARLAEIRAVVFPASQHFSYNTAYHQALIGRGGATLRQLQEDFCVAICIDTMPPGHGYVVGGAAEAQSCIAAITAIVRDEEAKNASTTLLFTEPHFRKELIGPRGSTVERFQDEYDVRMQMDETGVTITGRRHDVAEAKEAVRAHLETFTARDLAVPVAKLPSLLGRGGRSIARIIECTGVRALRVDRERGIVKATGTPDAIERAFALCRSATGEGEGVTRVVHADDAWVGAVIGLRGATIRKLEEETKAHIQCSGSTITLSGTRAEVDSAYERVVALRRTERTMPAETRRLHFLTSPIVSLTDVVECQSPTVRTPTVTRGGASYITPLEAVQRATACDHVFPLRAEDSIVLRGTADAVSDAYGMLKLLLRHNEPFSINVAFLDILRTFMTSRSAQWGNKNLLDYIPSLFSAPIRIDVDWGERRLTVSSCSKQDARAATSRLVTCLREYSATHVRLISNFPEYAISRLLGTRGSTIRKLQEATDTEILLVRDRAQVQVLNAAGNVECLESAVHAIRVAVFGEEDDDADDAGGPSQASEEAFAAQTPTRRLVTG